MDSEKKTNLDVHERCLTVLSSSLCLCFDLLSGMGMHA